jgi:hypothetical protein
MKEQKQALLKMNLKIIEKIQKTKFKKQNSKNIDFQPPIFMFLLFIFCTSLIALIYYT